jgi:PD-(D/E)XK nuclease superfamily protein
MPQQAILPPYIDSTMMSTFRSCPRKFYYEFILGLRPPGISIDLHAGGAFAHCLEVVRKEVFLKGSSLDSALLRANAAFEIYWGDFTIPEHKKTNKRPDRVWAAVESYFHQYPPLSDHIQPYFVDGHPTFEFTFAIPLDGPGFPVHPVSGEPFLYTGRFDLLGEYMGNPVVEDDKTSGAGHYANWTEKWDLRSQFIGYTWACRELGIDVDSVAVRGVGIQITQIAHAEAIKPYSDVLRARWLEQLRRDLTRLVAAWNEGYFDYNFGEACTDYSNCIFTQPCQSITPQPWLDLFEVRRWNPTRKDPTANEEPST